MSADPILDALADLLAGKIIDRLHHQQPDTGVADQNRYLDVEAAAEYMSIPEGQIRKMYQRRELPHLRVGKRVLFDRVEIDDFMHSHAVPVRVVGEKIDLRPGLRAARVGPETSMPRACANTPGLAQEA